MKLENYRSSWKQLQIHSSLEPLPDLEAIFSLEEKMQRRRALINRLLVNVGLFLIITLFIQGG